MFFLTSQMDSYVQLLTVLLIFVVVLGATALTTKWIAGYQKKQGAAGNIELLDAVRLGNNKYIQLVRLGARYIAVAVCKDTVTVIGEIKPEDLNGTVQNQYISAQDDRGLRFQDILNKLKNKASADESPVGDETQNADAQEKESLK